jgi:hypothetical protein
LDGKEAVGELENSMNTEAISFGVIQALEKDRDEWKAKYEAAEFWNDWSYPEGAGPQDVQNELTDYHMILDNVSTVYDHVTGGMISKPNTCASSVIAVADDHISDLIAQWIEDEKELNEEPEPNATSFGQMAAGEKKK